VTLKLAKRTATRRIPVIVHDSIIHRSDSTVITMTEHSSWLAQAGKVLVDALEFVAVFAIGLFLGKIAH
jgi:hypothetical protein